MRKKHNGHVTLKAKSDKVDRVIKDIKDERQPMGGGNMGCSKPQVE